MHASLLKLDNWFQSIGNNGIECLILLQHHGVSYLATELQPSSTKSSACCLSNFHCTTGTCIGLLGLT